MPTMLCMEESDFNARSDRDREVVIVSRTWENNVVMVRFYYKPSNWKTC